MRGLQSVVIARYWAPVVPRVKPGATFADAMHALAKATLAAVEERRSAAEGGLTGLAYTLKNPDLRAQVHDVTKSSYEFGAEWVGTFRSKRATDAARSSRARASYADRRSRNAAHHHADLCPDEVFYAAFAALAHKSG